MVEKRILGTEKITLVDGTEKEITIKAMSGYEKLRLIKKHTKHKLVNGYTYKSVDEVGIMMDILSSCIDGANPEELDFDIENLYNKYFKSSPDKTKKENTSTTSQTV